MVRLPGLVSVEKYIRRGLDWLLAIGGVELEERVHRASALSGSSRADERRAQEDPAAWYLALTWAALEAPASLDYLSAPRVVPFMAALGRNASTLSSISGVDDRVERLLSIDNREHDVDAVLFELLVAAAYARQGWSVRFIPETPKKKTPDMAVSRAGEERWVECKRMAARSEAARAESSEWRRLWAPLSSALRSRKLAVVLNLHLHRPMERYSDTYLVDRLLGKIPFMPGPGTLIDDDELCVHVAPVEWARVRRELDAAWAKKDSPREVELVTGRYEPRREVELLIDGATVSKGDPTRGPSDYWTSIDFACGAFWSCDAEESMARRARDIRSKLAKAVTQVQGDVPSSIHVGLETHERESIEDARLQRVMKTVSEFHAGGTKLDWIFCHLFGPEAAPDKAWDIGETTLWHSDGSERPIKEILLVAPEDSASTGGVHWNSALT